MNTPLLHSDAKVGDHILFDHFGGKDRHGYIVKITKSAVHVSWTAPSSGATRIVSLSTKPYPYSETRVSEYGTKNVRLVIERPTQCPCGRVFEHAGPCIRRCPNGVDACRDHDADAVCLSRVPRGC